MKNKEYPKELIKILKKLVFETVNLNRTKRILNDFIISDEDIKIINLFLFGSELNELLAICHKNKLVLKLYKDNIIIT